MKLRRRNTPIFPIWFVLLDEWLIYMAAILFMIFLISVAAFISMAFTLFVCFPFCIVAMENGDIQEVMQFMNTFLCCGGIMLLTGVLVILITRKYSLVSERNDYEGSKT